MHGALRRIDWVLTLSALLLTGVGLFAIYSIGSESAFYFFKKQLCFTVLGFFVLLFLSFFDYRVFKNNSLVVVSIYFLSLFSLGLVLFSPAIQGASSWFSLGPLSVEPVEFVKIAVILLLAKYFSLRHIEMYRVRHLIVSALYIAPLVGLVLLQPDFGSALILVSAWFGVVVISGIRLRHLLVLFVLFSLLFGVSWLGLLEDYQKQRILTFLNPKQDPYGEGYHISQSLIAVGSGKLLGQGSESSSQAGLKFLPAQHTDFVFATLAEQRGLFGVAFLLALYGLFFWRVIKIALESMNNFSKLFATGFAVVVFTQVFINIGMNIGVMPITGITLPLVSYGGSSLLSLYIGLGVLQSINSRN